MKIDYRDLQKHYQAHIRQKIPPIRERCPDAEELFACFGSRKSKKRKNQILDHVVNCAYCFQEFDFLLQTLREEEKLVEQIGALVQPGKRSRPIQKRSSFFKLSFGYASLLLGATMLVLSLAILLKNDFLKPRPKEARGKPTSSIVLLQPLEKTGIYSPLVFRWRESDGSDSYALELYDEALSLVWRSPQIAGTKIVLPHDVFSRLIRKKNYFWMVTSFKEQEKRRESSLQRFYLSD